MCTVSVSSPDSSYYENWPGPNSISRVCFNRNGTFSGPFLINLHRLLWAIFQVNGTMAHGPLPSQSLPDKARLNGAGSTWWSQIEWDWVDLMKPDLMGPGRPDEARLNGAGSTWWSQIEWGWVDLMKPDWMGPCWPDEARLNGARLTWWSQIEWGQVDLMKPDLMGPGRPDGATLNWAGSTWWGHIELGPDGTWVGWVWGWIDLLPNF